MGVSSQRVGCGFSANDEIFSYLARHASVGLTYSREAAGLDVFSDASWEVKHSTSGYNFMVANGAPQRHAS